jgi:hypothetical protein
MNTTKVYSRNGFKWSVNEILSLQREFELLGWDIDTIAVKHNRTPIAIMYKLDKEGFADYNTLYSNYFNSLYSPISLENMSINLDDKVDHSYNEHGDTDYHDTHELSGRIYVIEEGISEIKDMLNTMMSSISKSSYQQMCYN